MTNITFNTMPLLFNFHIVLEKKRRFMEMIQTRTELCYLVQHWLK